MAGKQASIVFLPVDFGDPDGLKEFKHNLTLQSSQSIQYNTFLATIERVLGFSYVQVTIFPSVGWVRCLEKCLTIIFTSEGAS